MGRTSRWFRSLLGSKKLSGKRGGTGNNGSFCSEDSSYPHGLDANKHAIVVAAATANAAEAALVAARAAAEVVRLTATSGTGRSRAATGSDNYAGTERRRHLAAVILQSAFRAYLVSANYLLLKFCLIDGSVDCKICSSFPGNARDFKTITEQDFNH